MSHEPTTSDPLRMFMTKPSVDEVEAMRLTLIAIADDLGVGEQSDDLLVAAAMLRSLSVDGTQREHEWVSSDHSGNPSEQGERHCKHCSLREPFLHANDGAVRYCTAQRAQPQVEPPLYTISKDAEGNVTVTTTPQVGPVATVTGYKQITPALVIGTKLYAAPTVQTSASPTPAAESAPPE